MTSAAPDDRLTAQGFREHFPALRRWVWLDTPGSPPAAAPVAEALSSAVTQWRDGSFEWLTWDACPQQVRESFARYVAADPDTVALIGSVAEGAATVAASLPSGRIVVLEDEFRSNLFPWLAADGSGRQVVRVPARAGVPRDELLASAVTPDTVLVAVSEVLSSDGARVDLPLLRAATDAVGARLFVDASQSLGVLGTDWDALSADYVACHGYKWLLCPRGAGWLVVRPDRLPELQPLMPGWKSTAPPHGYFGGELDLPATAARLDCSPAWLSWLGAAAALELLLRTDRSDTETHCVALAARMRDGLAQSGYRLLDAGRESQIVAAGTDQPQRLADAFRQAGVKATVSADRFRVGFHYFNNQQDVDIALQAAVDAAH